METVTALQTPLKNCTIIALFRCRNIAFLRGITVLKSFFIRNASLLAKNPFEPPYQASLLGNVLGEYRRSVFFVKTSVRLVLTVKFYQYNPCVLFSMKKNEDQRCLPCTSLFNLTFNWDFRISFYHLFIILSFNLLSVLYSNIENRNLSFGRWSDCQSKLRGRKNLTHV